MSGAVLSLGDIYGSTGPGAASSDTSVEGASGPLGSSPSDQAAAFSWLGFVVLLVVLRVVYELAS